MNSHDDDTGLIFLIDADTDPRAESYYGEGWRALDTMPHDKAVIVLSKMGLVREAIRSSKDSIRRSDRLGPRRMHVIQVSDGKKQAAKLQAVAWRPKP